MKKILIIAICFIAACSGNKKPENQEKGTIFKKSGITEFVVNKEIHNFGEVISGEVLVYSFTLKNTGANTLKINKIDEGCGCISVETNNMPISPGEEGTISVTFDSSGLYGNQFKTISLKVNTQEKTKELAIAANVINENINYKY